MNRLEKRRACPKARRRNQSNRTHQRRGRIAQNVAEHVAGQHHVKLRRLQRKLHRRIVHVHVLQLHGRVDAAHRHNGPPPKLRTHQNVGLVHRTHAPRAILRPREGKRRNALDLRSRIRLRIPCALDAILGYVAPLAEVHSSRKLAHNLNIQIAQTLRLKRRNSAQRLQHLHRTHIHIKPHPRTQTKQPALRPLPYRKRIPLCPSDGPQKNRVRFLASIQRFVGKRRSVGINGRATDREVVQLKLVVEFVRALPQHGCRGARNFRPDAVSRQQHNGLFHLGPRLPKTRQARISLRPVAPRKSPPPPLPVQAVSASLHAQSPPGRVAAPVSLHPPASSLACSTPPIPPRSARSPRCADSPSKHCAPNVSPAQTTAKALPPSPAK